MAHMAETNPPQRASGRTAGPVRRNLPQGGRRVVRVTRSGLSISGLVFLHADSRCGEVKGMLNLRTIICYCAWWLAGGVLGLKQAYSADLLVQPA